MENKLIDKIAKMIASPRFKVWIVEEDCKYEGNLSDLEKAVYNASEEELETLIEKHCISAPFGFGYIKIEF